MPPPAPRPEAPVTLADPAEAAPRRGAGWLMRLAASRRFQAWASRFPLTRPVAARDGGRLMDLVAGFVHSQVLRAVVELEVVERLMEAPATAAGLARGTGVPAQRMVVLLDAAASLGLLRRGRGATPTYRPARLGAALLGVPGLRAMIRHHDVLYRDLADPTAFLRGGTEPELARFWPYVFGAAQAEAPEIAARYSRLMTESQDLVAEETLRRVDLSRAAEVLDVGGGTGAFLRAVGAAHGCPRLHLFDLPAVVAPAAELFAQAGLADRARVTPGSFRDDSLPSGADTLSLVRVCYDHADETVMALLRAAHAALPPGGRLVLSEPMAGGDRPERAGDAYFALYTMAMGTGRARSPATLGGMLGAAGFGSVRDRGTTRPYVTHVMDARRP
jgi:demethylspheroidene O-methyltransferase